MFLLKENGLEFAFDFNIGVKNKDGFYESEINGAVPVPKLLSKDRIILPIDEGIVINADGEYENGEIGYDLNDLNYIFCSREGTLSMIVIERDKKYLMYSQNHLCPLVGMERMRDEVVEIVEKYPYYKGRFIDVYGGSAAEKCFSPKHPINSFEECLKIKKTAFNNLKEMGLIAGTEDGFEDLADELIYTDFPKKSKLWTEK